MGDQARIDELAAEIKAVGAKVDDVDEAIKQARAERNDEEVAALRREKEQLRREKEQLQEEKLLLLQARPGARYCVWRRWFALTLVVCAALRTAVERQLASVPERCVPTATLERLVSAFERLASRQEPVVHDTTDAALGDKTLKLLQRLGAVHDFAGDEAAGPAALDAAALQVLAACQSETELVKCLTPVLWHLCVAGDAGADDACGYVLVNCENCRWLDNLGSPLRPDMRLKPDLFEAPRVCVKERAGTDKQGSGAAFIFGGLAHRHLQRDGCVRKLFEGKHDALTLAHFGELVKYHRLIPGECRGMLFNGTQFWLFASVDGSPVKLARAAWAAPGSASPVRHFFDQQPQLPPPPLLPLLRQLLSALRLRPAQVDGSTFLGAGAFGRVFAVQSTEPTIRHAHSMALKLVPAAASATWLGDLTHEFKALQDAAALGVPVVPIVADSLRVLDGLGGGYLLCRCGVPFDATASEAACSAAFVALAALHARAVIHGDARLPNLLLVDGRAAWVDLSAGVLAGLDAHTRAANCRLDMETLALSVLQTADVAITPLPPSIASAIAAYNGTMADAARTVAAAVWAAAQGGRMKILLPAAQRKNA